MELTAAASWLNSFFAGYDKLILTILHAIACGPLTALFKMITLIGEKGIVFFLVSLVLMCFSKTRKTGVCLFGAVACGALITNIILKDMVARPRPFEAMEIYRQWWTAIGQPAEDGFSFPSGHVTAAAAGMTAIRLMKGRKWTAPAIIWIVVMAVARNYLMAHFPSDVLAAAVVGIISAFVAKAITELIFRFLDDREDVPLWNLVLEFDLPDFFGLPSRLGLIDAPSSRGSRRKSFGYHGKHEK